MTAIFDFIIAFIVMILVFALIAHWNKGGDPSHDSDYYSNYNDDDRDSPTIP